MTIQAFSISESSLTGPTGQTFIITGGSGGIGLQTAILLHKLGNNVVAIDRAEPHPSAPASLTSSDRFLYAKADITNWKSQRSAFEAAVTKFGNIDGCFVNAGINELGDQFFKDELDADGLLAEPNRLCVEIDLLAACDTVRLAVHYMRKRKSPGAKRGGGIVMTASLAGYLASAGLPLYSAAKHGIVGLMRALKNDLATQDIAISVVAPGITLTDMVAGREPGQSLEEWRDSMQATGVPINNALDVGVAVVQLLGLGMKANGRGYVVQANRVADLEQGIRTSRKDWMGEEMLRLFRGGRTAPLFPNKL